MSSAEVDIELFTFVERYATTLIRWDLLLYFGKTPNARCTAPEIARHLRRGLYATTKELDDLTYLRVLSRRYTPEKTTYQLSRRATVRRSATRLARFVNGNGAPAHVTKTRSSPARLKVH